jgi:hypothetical protein
MPAGLYCFLKYFSFSFPHTWLTATLAYNDTIYSIHTITL